MPEFVALILIGMLAGLLAGLLGIGGGLVIVPAMTALLLAQGAPLDLALPMAVATALGSMLLTSASSAWAHARRGNPDWSAALRLGPAVAVGSALGAWLASEIPGQALARVFAVLVGLIALRMLLTPEPAPRRVPPAARGWWWFGPISGALSAMVGIGGGSFNVPYLRFNGYPMLVSVGTAAACGWPIALAGSAAFMCQGLGRVDWPGSLGYAHLNGSVTIGLVGALTAPAGVWLATRIGSAALTRLFALFLLLVAGRMALQ